MANEQGSLTWNRIDVAPPQYSVAQGLLVAQGNLLASITGSSSNFSLAQVDPMHIIAPGWTCSTFSFQRSRSRAHLFLGIPMLCIRMQCGAVFQRLSEHSLPTLFSRLILLLGAIIC